MAEKSEHTTNRQRTHRAWLPRERPSSLWARIARTALVFAVLIALWWLASLLVAKTLILPTPLQVLVRLGELVFEAVFWKSVLATLGRILLGFCAGMALGALFAFAMYRLEAANLVFAPLIRIIQATPIVSFILIALIWLPTNALPVVISGMMVLPIAWSSIAGGLKSINRNILEMASVFRIGRARMLAKVFLPALRPSITAAAISGIGLAWKSGITAEVLALPALAIGRGIYNAKIYLETPDLFAWTLVVIALSFALEAGFKALMRPSPPRAGLAADHSAAPAVLPAALPSDAQHTGGGRHAG
ncbi:MAG: ABC transporter permease subunit [Eggerthellaceae bacterium]|nr:ABC transporter permease subunit [Eggerthellaceae bacterium]